jgi:hypothetical protein
VGPSSMYSLACCMSWMTSAFPRPCARTRRPSPPTCCTHRAGSAPPAALINRRWGPPSDQADRWLLGGPASGERPPAQTKQRTIRSAACPVDLRSTPPAAPPAPFGVLCEVRRRRRRVPRLDRDGPPADRRPPGSLRETILAKPTHQPRRAARRALRRRWRRNTPSPNHTKAPNSATTIV